MPIHVSRKIGRVEPSFSYSRYQYAKPVCAGKVFAAKLFSTDVIFFYLFRMATQPVANQSGPNTVQPGSGVPVGETKSRCCWDHGFLMSPAPKWQCLDIVMSCGWTHMPSVYGISLGWKEWELNTSCSFDCLHAHCEQSDCSDLSMWCVGPHSTADTANAFLPLSCLKG